MTNYYDILEVSPDASQDEIKSSYRKLASIWHPDKNVDKAASTEKFQQINEAYETLSNPEKRHHYDQNLKFGEQPNWNPYDHFEEILRNMSQQGGNSGFFRWPPPTPRNRDINYNLHISLDDAFNGKQMSINIQFLNITRNLICNIPAGIDSGFRIKFSGQGENIVAESPAGDIYIVIHVQPHPRFVRHGHDLLTEIAIDAFRAAMGTKIDVLSIDNKNVSIELPPGTQPEQIITVPGQGMPVIGHAHRGDLLIKINVKVPTVVSQEHKEMLEKIMVTY